MPTGGVIRLISVTTTTTMPNQISTDSGPASASEPKLSPATSGAKTGTVSRIIERLSRTHPSTR